MCDQRASDRTLGHWYEPHGTWRGQRELASKWPMGSAPGRRAPTPHGRWVLSSPGFRALGSELVQAHGWLVAQKVATLGAFEYVVQVVRHYPLESLGAARRLSKERQVQRLGRQVQRTNRAATVAANARAAHQQQLEANHAIELEERSRLNEGSVRAADLLATAAWRSRAGHQAACLARQAYDAEQRLSEELRAQEAARTMLSAAEADVMSAAKHRARWEQRQAVRRQTLAEDEAGDVWSGQRRRSRVGRDKGR